MRTETETWTNEQPDGSIVYGLRVKLFEDDGTYIGAHTRQWDLSDRPPTPEAVEATKAKAVRYVEDRAEEMRQRARARRQRAQKREDRKQRSQAALDSLPVSS